MKRVESWSKREERESTDLVNAFLFGAAISTPFWLTVAAALTALAAWR